MSWFKKRPHKHPRFILSDSGFFSSQRATQMPTPGAMEYGFATELLAAHPLIGPAIMYSTQWRNFEPQNYQQQSVIWVNGLGGLAQGQIVGQPLSNPYGG